MSNVDKVEAADLEMVRSYIQLHTFVEKRLGDDVICPTCGATVASYFAGACTAGPPANFCAGFMAIENAKAAFIKGTE